MTASIYKSRLHRSLSLVLAIALAVGPAANIFAQTNAAAQAVRNRVAGAAGLPEESAPEPVIDQPAAVDPAATSSIPADASTGGIDTKYISPTAIAVLVVRPAQLLKSPLAELLPTEAATAAGMQYLGFDPADVDEVVAFGDPIPTNYAITFKFNKPFRGTSIAPQMRPMVQLSELAGRKYLQSAHPMMPSFYGINKQTLIAAPDAVMRPLVESASSSASSPLLDRVRAEPAGSDLFLAVDFNAVRPFIQMGLTDELKAKLPPPAQPLLEAINLISAITLTVNLSQPAPSSLVLHANDETAAQQLEGMVQGMQQTVQAAAQAQAVPGDPISDAMIQYRNRISQKFTAPRNGTAVPVFYIDGKNPAQQHLLALGIIAGVSAAAAYPKIQQAQQAALQGQLPTSAMPADPNAPPAEDPAP